MKRIQIDGYLLKKVDVVECKDKIVLQNFPNLTNFQLKDANTQ